MRQIYLDASMAAAALANRATVVALQTDNVGDKLTANDIAFAANRFSYKATAAAEKLLLLQNDGTLRAFCEQFDKAFAQFCLDAEIWETQLYRIKKPKPVSN